MSPALVWLVIVVALALGGRLIIVVRRTNRSDDERTRQLDTYEVVFRGPDGALRPVVAGLRETNPGLAEQMSQESTERPVSGTIWPQTVAGPEQSVLHLNEEVTVDVG